MTVTSSVTSSALRWTIGWDCLTIWVFCPAGALWGNPLNEVVVWLATWFDCWVTTVGWLTLTGWVAVAYVVNLMLVGAGTRVTGAAVAVTGVVVVETVPDRGTYVLKGVPCLIFDCSEVYTFWVVCWVTVCFVWAVVCATWVWETWACCTWVWATCAVSWVFWICWAACFVMEAIVDDWVVFWTFTCWVVFETGAFTTTGLLSCLWTWIGSCLTDPCLISDLV